MANERDIKRLEKDIKVKMVQIKSGLVLPKDSNIGKSLNLMKSFDEPLHDTIMDSYKKILKDLKS